MNRRKFVYDTRDDQIKQIFSPNHAVKNPSNKRFKKPKIPRDKLRMSHKINVLADQQFDIEDDFTQEKDQRQVMASQIVRSQVSRKWNMTKQEY